MLHTQSSIRICVDNAMPLQTHTNDAAIPIIAKYANKTHQAAANLLAPLDNSNTEHFGKHALVSAMPGHDSVPLQPIQSAVN